MQVYRWADAGHEITYEQFKLPIETPAVPAPDFWRAPTDNDIGTWHMEKEAATWRNAGSNRKLTNIKTDIVSPHEAKVTSLFTIPASTPSNVRLVYSIYGSGDVLMDYSFTPGASSLPLIPEIGVLLTLPSEFENVTR
ncbi:hypothetical protein JW960_16725 [candidate division KSB1 bacterium]|nr:hypothetical protein [candidate division KSB1 bacterium]